MPSIEYRRHDLVIALERGLARVRFQSSHSLVTAPNVPTPQAASVLYRRLGRLEGPEFVSTAASATLIAGSGPWKEWISSTAPHGENVIPRVCLEIADPDVAAVFWEKDLAEKAAQASPDAVVVRTSPVRPRCANFAFRTPLRIVRVNGGTSEPQFPGLEQTHRGKLLAEYSHAFSVAEMAWIQWASDFIPNGWPNVDILHIEPGLEFPAHALSTNPDLPGSVAWVAELLDRWQVRLLVLRIKSSPRKISGATPLEQARQFATALVARGGPAVVVSETGPPSGPGFARFYRELLHDRPLDWMLRYLQEMGRAEATLFCGASREEQLRISRAASSVPAKLPAIKIPASPRKGPAKKAAEKKNAPAKAAARKKSVSGAIKPKKKIILEEPVVRYFMEPRPPMAADILDFRHESAFLNVAKQYQTLRKKIQPEISATQVLRGTRATEPSDAPRFCNASFWRESPKGLQRTNQKYAGFRAGEMCHFAIQIGPKDVRIVTAREQAFVEEVIKWTPEMQGVWVEIGVTGIEFHILGDPVQSLWLPRHGPSEPVYFAVVPKRDGVCRLRLSLYYRQNVVQSFRIAAMVGTNQRGRKSKLAKALGLKVKETPDVSWLPMLEFSLAPSMEHFAGGKGEMLEPRALSIVANDSDGDAVITVKGAGRFAVNVSRNLPLQVKDLRDRLFALSGFPDNYPFDGITNAGPQEQLKSILRLLADEGNKLFLQLFDAADWDPLAACLESPDQIIQVAQMIREEVIPWTFVYSRGCVARTGDRDTDGKLVNMPVCLAGLPGPDGTLPVKKCGESPQCLQNTEGLAPENVICPMHFWGFRHRIEIPPQQVPPKPDDSGETAGVRTEIEVDGNARVVAGLNATFEAEPGHMTKLAGLKGKIAFTREEIFARDGLLKRLAASPIHLVYFFCHATGGKGTSDAALILQAPESKVKETIPWQDFARILKGKKWQPPALVFLNGCRTVAFSPEAFSPFLRVFVDLLGASGLIGTEISVWDVFAAEMAEKFLAEFFNCETAGKALLTARRAMLAKGNPFGLIYTLFAWSNLRLVGRAA